MRRLFLVCSLALAPLSPATADEIWQGLESGDLVVLETTGPLATFLKKATGSRLTHIGIMRNTGGGPYVIDATPQEGVFEADIEDFVARGSGGHYAVYRLEGLEHPAHENHPAIKAAYDHHYMKPYDPFFRRETSAFYDAELVWTAYAEAGVELGKFRRLRDLGADTPEGRAVFLHEWRNNPDCKSSASAGIEACWQRILDTEIITPASILDDPRLRRVYSTFPGER
ncbi:YiiX/YebB-like N1pC/P60 family cysteine hydrolase [Breoghania sp. JC706]|uniref:YiiX/YebB-like N1pC/P60 family cysteine hydrolase n=1 Tax=Breoghania sp. JC706 TaxID=3117732 RepID=UPI00300A5CCF